MLKIVEIDHLTIQYPDLKAIDDVSFTVNQGDFLGIKIGKGFVKCYKIMIASR